MNLAYTNATVAVSGRFSEWTKGELEIVLKARGVARIAGSPTKSTLALFCDTPDNRKAEKAKKIGVPVVLPSQIREALGAPLAGFRERFEHFVHNREDYYHNHTFAMGEPASREVLTRVEERIGFDLPEAARNLWSQLDGFSWLWTFRGLSGPTSRELLAWNVASHGDGALWKSLYAACEADRQSFSMGLCCIPRAETIFFTKWDGISFVSDGYTARDKLKLGRRKVNARHFFDNLFLFDFFHPYYQAGLWADSESQQLYVVYSSDHGAAWDVAAPVPLEIYMECLLAERANYRTIDLSNKRGATRAMTNIAGKPYWVLAPYRSM